ncbi:MAG: nitronate monooxygenase [Desulfobacterales bacterium]|jgi:NADH:quinone reductase (non-electrogenic)|nr:nitronate monooxygenase [Desulfobacteraceae bacterium]MBT7085892.1 nitronate monooxygenase [Desulfobacterales bacterium]MBT7697826.1 nitronate monooxygenase [Desulfobacterales bacterium]
MIKTAITETFGVEYPIICGAMMYICEPNLCAAISNAGGLGNLTAGMYHTEEEFKAAIHETKKLTDKPFMVNITFMPSVHITKEHQQMYVQVCADEKVAGVEISGMPIDKAVGMEAIELLKKANVKMFHKVGSVRHAKHAEKVGYDGVYAAGIEEGGHPLNDDVTTMILTPRIKEETSFLVVSTGGIATGKTMAAALMLGADGVMMASRFMASKDALIHQNIKEELVKREEHDTVLINKSIHMQMRALKNQIVAEIQAVEEKGGGIEELYPLIKGERHAEAYQTGDVDYATFAVGQSIGLIHDLPTCKEVLTRMTAEAEEEIKNLNGMIQ